MLVGGGCALRWDRRGCWSRVWRRKVGFVALVVGFEIGVEFGFGIGVGTVVTVGTEVDC